MLCFDYLFKFYAHCIAYQHNIWQGVPLLQEVLQLVIHKVSSGQIVPQSCVPSIQQVPQMRPDMVRGVVASQVCHSGHL